MTTIKRFEAGATVTPSHTAHLQIKPKDDTPKETITWKGKTYSIKVMKKGQIYHPKTQQEWTALKAAHIKLLDSVNKQNNFEGSRRIRVDNSAQSLTFVKDGKRSVIHLKETFDNPSVTPEDKAAYETHKNEVVTLIFKQFTNTDPIAAAPPVPDAPETPPVSTETGNTGTPPADTARPDDTALVPPTSHHEVVADTPEARKARLESATEMLTEEDLGQFLEKLKTNHQPDDFPFDYSFVGPATVTPNAQLQEVPFDFAGAMRSALERTSGQVANINDLVFAMPYLENGHFKLVLVDFQSNIVFHYDPLSGKQISKSRQDQLVALAGLLEQITGKVPDVIQNLNTHQTDSTSCGHFVLDYVKNVVEGYEPYEYMARTFDPSTLPQVKQSLAEYYLPTGGTPATGSTNTQDLSSDDDDNESLPPIEVPVETTRTWADTWRDWAPTWFGGRTINPRVIDV